jgi:hypothetical protein
VIDLENKGIREQKRTYFGRKRTDFMHKVALKVTSRDDFTRRKDPWEQSVR